MNEPTLTPDQTYRSGPLLVTQPTFPGLGCSHRFTDAKGNQVIACSACGSINGNHTQK